MSDDREPLLVEVSPRPAAQREPGTVDATAESEAPDELSEGQRKLKHQLETQFRDLSVLGVDETKLHDVQWGDLLSEFALIVLPTLALLGLCVYMQIMVVEDWSPIQTWLLAWFLFVLTAFVVVIAVEFIDTYTSGVRVRSELWSCLTRVRHVHITSRFHLYCLVNAMKTDAKTVGQDEELVIHVGATSVDDQPEFPPKPLNVDGLEVIDLDYKLVALWVNGGDVLKTFHKWEVVDEIKALPLREQDQLEFPCVAMLRDRGWGVKRLSGHWLAHVVWGLTLAMLLVLPEMVYYMHLDDSHDAYCDPAAPPLRFLPDRGAICPDSGTPCEREMCDSIVKFNEALMSYLHISGAEVLFNMLLMLVIIWLLAVRFVQAKHLTNEARYNMQTNQMEAREYQIQRATLNQFCQIFGALRQFGRVVRMLLERQLAVCGPLEGGILKDSLPIRNRIFKHIFVPVNSLMHVDELYGSVTFPVAFGERYRKDAQGRHGKLIQWREKMDSVKKSWEFWMETHVFFNLKENAKIKPIYFLPVRCKEALHILVEAFFKRDAAQGGYNGELKEIFAVERCQDEPWRGGVFHPCHVQKTFKAGPLLVPERFCLTHIVAVVQNPLSRTPEFLQLEIGPHGHIKGEEEFFQLLEPLDRSKYKWQKDKYGMGQLYHKFADYGDWPPVLLTAAEDDKTVDDLEDEFGTDYVYEIDFVFQISSGYFQGLKEAHEEVQEGSLYEYWENVTASLDEVPPDVDTRGDGGLRASLRALKRQSWPDLHRSSIGLVVGEGTARVFRKFWFLAGVLANHALICLVSVGFALVAPVWRQMEGGSLFPRPFRLTLFLSFAGQAGSLFYFLSKFWKHNLYLRLIEMSLLELESQTSTPPSGAGKRKERSGDDKNYQTEAFDLYLADMDPYSPHAPFWQRLWNELRENVMNWHVSTGHLRLLVSASRAQTQALLVAAAAILLTFAAMSLWQAFQGRGMLQTDNDALLGTLREDIAAALSQGVEAGKASFEAAKEHIQGGISAGGRGADGAEAGDAGAAGGDGAAGVREEDPKAIAGAGAEGGGGP